MTGAGVAVAWPGQAGQAGPSVQPGQWRLTWADEFNGPAGAPVSPARWRHDVGSGDWGNSEQEYYTPGTANAALDGAGQLAITVRRYTGTALRCVYDAAGRYHADGIPCAYTSARLITLGKFSQAYGRFEARIKIPRGQGLWPAFWALGQYSEWPFGGEIDVMENIGDEPAADYGTAHGPVAGTNPVQVWSAGGIGRLPGRPALGAAFHLYGVDWYPDRISFWLDGVVFKTVYKSKLPARDRWVFNQKAYLLLNVAVGSAASWPGAPDATTQLPQTMLIDYVRVYTRNPGLSAPPG